jgi:hypothetical protein
VKTPDRLRIDGDTPSKHRLIVRFRVCAPFRPAMRGRLGRGLWFCHSQNTFSSSDGRASRARRGLFSCNADIGFNRADRRFHSRFDRVR